MEGSILVPGPHQHHLIVSQFCGCVTGGEKIQYYHVEGKVILNDITQESNKVLGDKINKTKFS